MRTLSNEALLRWLDDLARQADLYGPALSGGVPLFRRVRAAAELSLDYGGRVNTVDTPKDCFFPATEPVVELHRNGAGIELATPGSERGRVLFGVRPCDAAALSCLDAVFLQPPPDLLYARKRAGAALVGVACLQPGPQCFCTSVGGRPDGTDNLDVLLTPLDGGYAVRVLTQRGEQLLATATLEEHAGDPPAAEEPGQRFPVPEPDAWAARFNDEYWSRLGERCLGCKVCTFNCPTCYCFDVRDYSANGVVQRLRCWDSCQAKDFYTEASGHNPRPAQWMRLRNRFYHKFHYFPSRFGLVKCVGCGRCIAQCPVGIDVTEVLDDVSRLSEPAGVAAWGGATSAGE